MWSVRPSFGTARPSGDHPVSNGPPGWQNLSSLAKLFCFIGHLAEIVELQSVANRKKLRSMSTSTSSLTLVV